MHPSTRSILVICGFLSLGLVAISLSLLFVAGTAVPAQAQGSDCINGQNCCVVAASTGSPRRYAVACDGGAQTAFSAASNGGYPIVVFGPASWQRCGAWMANAGIPGWEQYRNPQYQDTAPPPDTSCTLGQNCCYVGSNNNQPPQYAIGYDGGAGSGSMALANAGYHHIVYGPVSAEACNAYFNRIAGGGFGTPSGAVPMSGSAGPSGAGGPRQASAGWRGAPQSGISLSLSVTAWQQAPNYIGAVSQARSGLVAQGGPWTNGRLANGVYDGNRIQSRDEIDLSSGGDIYAVFAIDGGGKYMAFWPRLLTGIGVPAFSTDHSWAKSIVVGHRAPLYGHLRVNPGGSYQFTVAEGGYDDHGGRVLHRGNGALANPRGKVDFQYGDNYGGRAASLTVYEVWVYHDGAGPSGQRLPGGARCGAPGECDSGICLLGVCASR